MSRTANDSVQMPQDSTEPNRNLDQTARRSQFEQLHSEGVISSRTLRRVRELLSSPARSWWWFDVLLLATGTILLVTGFGFLVAFNWHEIPKFGKFAIVEIPLAACLFGAAKSGLETRLGKASLVGACCLVGVFLALYGQIYQTGADPWELFWAWSVLIFGFVLLGRSLVVWGLWILLVTISSLLYRQQMLPSLDNSVVQLWAWLALFYSGLFAWREAVLQWKRPKWLLAGDTALLPGWLTHQWPTRLLVLAALVCLGVTNFAAMALLDQSPGWATTALISNIAVGGCCFYFAHGDRNLFVEIASAVFLGAIDFFWIWRIAEYLDFSFSETALTVGFAGLSIVTLVVFIARTLWRSRESNRKFRREPEHE